MSLGLPASPLAPRPDGPLRVARIAVPDLASPVTPRNHISPIQSDQFITGRNVCDDVSVNMSLYGNERETPSIRSLLTAGRGLGPMAGSGLGPRPALRVGQFRSVRSGSPGRDLAPRRGAGSSRARARPAGASPAGLAVPCAPSARPAPLAPAGSPIWAASGPAPARKRHRCSIDVALAALMLHRCRSGGSWGVAGAGAGAGGAGVRAGRRAGGAGVRAGRRGKIPAVPTCARGTEHA
jgi:hypothetical protein